MRRPFACTFVIAAALGTGACATTGATPRPFPTPNPPAPATGAPEPAKGAPETATAAHPGGAGLGYSVAGSALGLRGAPYRNGGNDPGGFDCSGLVNYVFAQNGVRVPRTVGEQFRAGRQVDPAQIEAGDLVFFSTVAPGATHVGISIGGDEFVHAPSGRGEVRVERLSGPYWATRFIGARRVL